LACLFRTSSSACFFLNTFSSVCFFLTSSFPSMCLPSQDLSSTHLSPLSPWASTDFDFWLKSTHKFFMCLMFSSNISCCLRPHSSRCSCIRRACSFGRFLMSAIKPARSGANASAEIPSRMHH
jgi:hypothetical protein